MSAENFPGAYIEELGVFGWTEIEPSIIAALATESPILLIGDHGTAKSYLLEALAKKLGLHFRHYNASTLNFDDLVGFPVPDEQQVRYLRTPLDAWDAEAIFVDELSRCRIDMQNRLFPLIHERRLQGQDLHKLRFRWAAMNPPPTDESTEDATYIGAEPLDPAFADRFHWVLTVPTKLSEEEELAMLLDKPFDRPPKPYSLIELIERTQNRLPIMKSLIGEKVAKYVYAVSLSLSRAHIPLSNRRKTILFQNILALMALSESGDLRNCCFVALKHSIPQRAQRKISSRPLIQAHKNAQAIIDDTWDEIRLNLLRETDPIKRILIALSSDNAELCCAIILDSWSSLSPAERLPLSFKLFEILRRHFDHLPAIVFETIMPDIIAIESLTAGSTPVRTHSKQYTSADAISRICAGLSSAHDWMGDCLWVAWRQGFDFDPDELLAFSQHVAHCIDSWNDARLKAVCHA